MEEIINGSHDQSAYQANITSLDSLLCNITPTLFISILINIAMFMIFRLLCKC